jgi:hypothetical protein
MGASCSPATATGRPSRSQYHLLPTRQRGAWEGPCSRRKRGAGRRMGAARLRDEQTRAAQESPVQPAYPGSVVYLTTWDRPGSRTRRTAQQLPAGGTPTCGVAPDRRRLRRQVADQRAGISPRLWRTSGSRLGRRNAAPLTRSQLDSGFQAAPLLTAPTTDCKRPAGQENAPAGRAIPPAGALEASSTSRPGTRKALGPAG